MMQTEKSTPIDPAAEGLQDDLRRRRYSLFPLVGEFNAYPLRYAHASWVPKDWPRDWLNRLRGCSGEKRISRFLLGYWGLPLEAACDFGDANCRIALVDGEALERAVLLAGAAPHWQWIAKVTEKDKLRRLKAEIGDETHEFLVQRARHLADPLPPPLPAGNGVAAPGLREEFFRAGLGQLAACVSGSTPELRTRLALKFPRLLANCLHTDCEANGLERENGYLVLKRILLTEVEPGWKALLP